MVREMVFEEFKTILMEIHVTVTYFLSIYMSQAMTKGTLWLC